MSKKVTILAITYLLFSFILSVAMAEESAIATAYWKA